MKKMCIAFLLVANLLHGSAGTEQPRRSARLAALAAKKSAQASNQQTEGFDGNALYAALLACKSSVELRKKSLEIELKEAIERKAQLQQDIKRAKRDMCFGAAFCLAGGLLYIYS